VRTKWLRTPSRSARVAVAASAARPSSLVAGSAPSLARAPSAAAHPAGTWARRVREEFGRE
jgi:hypothetical protein